MKNLTSLILVSMFCFVGLGLTGCEGGRESQVIENEATADENSGFDSQAQKDQYEEEMKKAMSQGR
jgi:hypothetical protein